MIAGRYAHTHVVSLSKIKAQASDADNNWARNLRSLAGPRIYIYIY